MKSKQSLWISVFFALVSVLTHAQPETQVARAPTNEIITFFIERAPLEAPSVEDALAGITEPGANNRMIIQDQLARRSVQGIYSTYMGWCTYSDYNGQIIFPRKHAASALTLILTRSLTPVLLNQTTIHHFVADPDEPVAYYQLKLFEDKKKKTFWNIQQIETPADRIIPYDALVIIAPPDQIIVSEGILPTVRGPNLVLPTAYTVASLTPGVNALHFLRINRYFSPVSYAWRHATNRYGVRVIP